MKLPDRSSIERLLAEPHRYGFFQAVRLLERWFGQQEAQAPAKVLSERLRFRNSLSMSFPASEIAEFKLIAAEPPAIDLLLPTQAAPLDDVVDATDAGHDPAAASQASATHDSRRVARIEITPAFIGLLGSGGALPTFYTEQFAQRETFHRDTAARAFLDIFQHRALVLFYQAWRKHRLAIQYEQDRRRHYLPLVLAVAGIGNRSLRDRLHGDEGGVADDTLAFYGGALQARPVSAGTIKRVLAQYFRVPVVLEQFVGRWFTLPPENRSLLGLGNVALGGGAVMGERVWQRDLRLRLTLGPLSREKFRRFLPGGPGALALRELLTLFTGVSLEYEVRLALEASAVRPAQLGGDDAPRLGWDGFLVTRPVEHDRTDAGYDIHALA